MNIELDIVNDCENCQNKVNDITRLLADGKELQISTYGAIGAKHIEFIEAT